MAARTVLADASLSEADQVRIATAIDWTDWKNVQSFRFPAGAGATSFIRTLARRFGLSVSIQRASDLIYLTLRNED